MVVNAAPFARITFLDGDGRHTERLWYHVPRVGDSVVLSTTLEMGEIVGTVKQVKWDDDGSVNVYVR